MLQILRRRPREVRESPTACYRHGGLSLRLITLFLRSCLAAALSGPVMWAGQLAVIEHPAVLAGEWQTDTPIAGALVQESMFIMIETVPEGAVQRIVRMTVVAKGGVFGVGQGFYPGHGSSVAWDGSRLVLNGDGLGLDVTLEANAPALSGIFRRGAMSQGVRLIRPRPARGAIVNVLNGEWKSVSTSRNAGCLHVAQGYDDALFGQPGPGVWMDRSLGSFRRYGEALTVEEMSPNSVVLVLLPPSGPRFEFRGVLSGDRSRLEGSWRPGVGAPSIFVRSRTLCSLEDQLGQ